MDRHVELINWFKRMGYDGEVPETLGNICNNSTSFIWDQLMQNAKPKQEVDNLRNNIIIHRLRSKPLNEQDEFSYPIKEITLYTKKQSLEEKLNNIKSVISEKRLKLDNLSQNNKMKYIVIEKLKSKIKENEERDYLLRKKCKMLERDIQEAEETLVCAKNLTPVELDENPNTKDITETLQKCAEKLEKLIRNIPAPSNYNNSNQVSFRQFRSVQKQPKTQSIFEKYLNMSEKKYSDNLAGFKRDGTRYMNKDNKENLGGKKKINKNLFGDGIGLNSKNKRESLGILHESYLKDNGESNFLTIETAEDIFFSPITSNKDHSDVIYPLKLQSTKQNLESNDPQQFIQKNISFDLMYSDELVTTNLKKLLYNHNRRMIWNTLQTLNDNLNSDLKHSITFNSGGSKKNKNVSEHDIAKLQFIHIQTELKTLKNKAVLKDLSSKIRKRKQQIYAAIAKKSISPQKNESIVILFEEKLADVGLDALLVEMKKEINSVKIVDDINDLQIILGSIAKTKDDIAQKVTSVKCYINSIYEILRSTSHTKEETVACIQKQGPFIEDITWAAPLTEKLCSAETRMFEKFPLEYNRRCTYTDPRIYYRDISDNIPADVDLDTDTVYMLTNILESPFSLPETVLLNVLKNKMKLNALKSLQNVPSNITYKKYSLKDLQMQESYVQYALDKLNSINYSTTSSKTLATADVIKKVMKIWMEMPLKDFISPKRTVEDKDYKFYERKYDSFYNNL